MTSATFWLILTVAALAWYGSVTIYVAIRGVTDIRQMIARLTARKADSAADEKS